MWQDMIRLHDTLRQMQEQHQANEAAMQEVCSFGQASCHVTDCDHDGLNYVGATFFSDPFASGAQGGHNKAMLSPRPHGCCPNPASAAEPNVHATSLDRHYFGPLGPIPRFSLAIESATHNCNNNCNPFGSGRTWVKPRRNGMASAEPT